MGTPPAFTPKELCRLLEKRGFKLKRIKGSHHYYQQTDTGRITVVPMHNKDLPKGTFHAILKQAGIDKNEL
ncbi:MAG TPA: type II toxin-antitoxin system HicA family toxin [Anditalea sp.]|nr:type II toxin-antitoxin system HicA family toxin [Anditalea sp.]